MTASTGPDAEPGAEPGAERGAGHGAGRGAKPDPEFGAALTRLLARRGPAAAELPEAAEALASDLRREPGLLRRLAPALGLHAADLFVLAGLPVPDDLAPLDAMAAQWAPHLVEDCVHLPAAGRGELLRAVRSFPQQERPADDRRTTWIGVEPSGLRGPGGKVIRMFRRRNLSFSGLARTMAVVTPSYLAASTYHGIGASRVELTPALVVDFAALLGIDALDLSALTGVALPQPPPPAAPEAVDAAALLWEARRLSVAQAEEAAELASALRGEPRNHYLLNLPGS
ncbi:hypothetical protein [Kitasatospora phosalacinea]|uniref:Uncharacterized protein n=1 Tax=Kitasatospora phosalacinea TaxID=2065 RepID=A0A9W6UN17_9ACTN|nr:hypothetical protein [Kitasatospora phosalacinea]GLW56021.1 hypothetical protein Kpho01_40320 [Kitasatospora phosalacinea]